MNSQTLGLLLGGILPALLFGIDGFCSKIGSRAGATPGMFMLVTGATIAFGGGVLTMFESERMLSAGAAGAAVAKGVAWTLASALVVYAINKTGVPVSKIAPVYSANVLVAVGLGLIFLGEWREANLTRLTFALSLSVCAILILARR